MIENTQKEGCSWGNWTQEQRQAMQEKSSQVRAEKKAFGLSEYRQQWGDIEVWRELASEAGVRLPTSYDKPNASKFKKLCIKLGVDYESYMVDNYGTKSFNQAVKDNAKALPEGLRYGMLAYVGWLLEDWKQNKENR